MSLDTALPDDAESLRRLLLVERQVVAEQAEELRQARAGLVEKTLELEKLKMQLAKLRRMSFGRSSEKRIHPVKTAGTVGVSARVSSLVCGD